ncbi:MAG: molecular chaperone HtpG [Bacteroidales bacterium]|nr:molecular chaperone HtpG [Bacteroidales bacterium]MBR5781644.1 molecular chaperone HtpG [Bacteroidales bacterium]
MQTGSIGVKTENIFPVIKKFLYSENEIFLREIVSNAVDATNKLKTLASAGEFKGELGDLTIRVEIDKQKKTLTIRDNGIGMTSAEVDKYINQIAFSGATEFVEKFKTQSEAEAANIIGHFGLGFYSSFMVSNKVALISKSFRQTEEEKGVMWECDGSPEYTMNEIPKGSRGTDVILYISDDCADFLEESKIRELLNKYCKFLSVPIQFGTKNVEEIIEGENDEDGKPKTQSVEKPWIINDVAPLWKKSPSSIEDKEYDDFYHVLYPMNFETPLFHIHLNVDYPFNLTGILYFPKIKNRYEFQRNKIQLYCNEVFVTDSVDGILPEFLTMLHGVIDSPDIPLNVSRSFLQNDQNVKKISGYITKKVAEKLEELFKKDRAEYEKKWDDISVFIEYGMIADPKFFERAEKFMLVKDTDGIYYTLEEYKKHIEENQKNKDNRLVYLYATNADEQYSNIENAKSKGYSVLMLDGILDSHFISTLEQKYGDCSFARVDSASIDKLIEKEDESKESKLNDEQKENIKKAFDNIIDKVTYHVEFSNLGEDDAPVEIIQNEFMRRMKEMSAMGGGMQMWGTMPDSYTLMLNVNNPVVAGLADKDEEAQKNTIKQLYDLARLSKNLLKGKDLNEFVKRSFGEL